MEAGFGTYGKYDGLAGSDAENESPRMIEKTGAPKAFGLIRISHLYTRMSLLYMGKLLLTFSGLDSRSYYPSPPMSACNAIRASWRSWINFCER